MSGQLFWVQNSAIDYYYRVLGSPWQQRFSNIRRDKARSYSRIYNFLHMVILNSLSYLHSMNKKLCPLRKAYTNKSRLNTAADICFSYHIDLHSSLFCCNNNLHWGRELNVSGNLAAH